jgi:hypothetical protein
MMPQSFLLQADAMPKVMRGVSRAFLIAGVLVGLGGGLAAATLVNWVEHPRLRAHVTVQTNGGAQESFLIRLPRDRILDSGTLDGLPARFPLDLQLPEGALVRDHVEQFKLRDREGEVIGVASRHTQALAGTTSAAWVLYLPGRGSLLLQHGESRGLTEQLRARGLRPGAPWNGEITLRRTGAGAGATGTVRGGSGAFSRHVGTYTETWLVTGVDGEGHLRGTLQLDTLTVRDE